ncbi:MAG TPA: PEP-CTERM sorting domain-containing protein [Prosthecobacter sp.]
MFVRSLFALALCTCTSAFGAVTLQDADSFWKFDGGSSGTATNAQIVDFTGNHVATSASRLSWNTSVPATSPAGGIPVDTLGRALNFGPTTVTKNDGAAVNDSVAAASFLVSNGTVSGNFSVITRAVWDGVVPGGDDALGYHWLLNNGLGGSGAGFLFGVQAQDSGNSGRLSYYTSATGVASGISTLAMTKGVWYDIGIVVDMGDNNAATLADNTVTFYLYGPGGLQTQTISGIHVSDLTSVAPGGNLLVGSESAGTGTSNQRKTYNGSLDYLAIFDVSMSQQDVLAIMAAPEPGRALLLVIGLAGLLMRRRRA